MLLGSTTTAVKGAVPWVHPPIASKIFRLGFNIRRFIILSYWPKARIVNCWISDKCLFLNNINYTVEPQSKQWQVKSCLFTSSALVVPFVSIYCVSYNFSESVHDMGAQERVNILGRERHGRRAVLCPVCKVAHSFVGLYI